MTQETIPYLHGNVMIGGALGGAVLVDGKILTPDMVMAATKAELAKFDKAKKLQEGWRPPSWWYDQRLESATEPSHYAGYLPVSLVKERLFGWQALDGNMRASVQLEVTGSDGNPTVVQVEIPVSEFKAIIREDKLRKLYEAGLVTDPKTNETAWTGFASDADFGEVVLGMHGEDYTQHQLAQTFITETANIIGSAGGELGITSAGLLRGGRVAWMEISIPKELHNDSTGFGYRPNLVVSTSFNGTLPTSWTRTITATVCDNTLQYALRQAGDTGKYKVRHTKNSMAHIKDAVQALGLLQQSADVFDETLKSWSETAVTERHFQEWLNAMYPVPDANVTSILSEAGEKIGQKTTTNSQTIVLNKRDRLIQMWDGDLRVNGPEGQWKGTKLALAQLINTYGQHEQTVKGVKSFGGNRLQARVEANVFKSLKTDKNGVSELEKADAEGLQKLDLILAASE